MKQKHKKQQQRQLLPSFAFDSSLPSTLIVIELPEVRTKTDRESEGERGKYFQFRPLLCVMLEGEGVLPCRKAAALAM